MITRACSSRSKKILFRKPKTRVPAQPSDRVAATTTTRAPNVGQEKVLSAIYHFFGFQIPNMTWGLVTETVGTSFNSEATHDPSKNHNAHQNLFQHPSQQQ
jgi:hypothetical protein